MLRTAAFRVGLLGVVVVFCALAFPPIYAQEVGVTWNGGAGDWSVATNWDLGVVPNNGGGTTYSATVGVPDSAVTMDVLDDTIDSLNLAETTSLTISTGDSLTLLDLSLNYGSISNNGTLNNSGTINYILFVSSLGTIDNTGTLDNSGTINSGSITNYDTILNTGTLNLAGTFTTSVGGTLTNYGTFSNSGTLAPTYFTQFINNAVLDNSGEFLLTDSSAFSNTGVVNNSGTISSQDNFGNAGTINNSGTISALSGAGNGGTINNSGTFSTLYGAGNAGTINNSGTFNNLFSGDNTGTINNTGVFNNNFSFWDSTANRGVINNSGTFNNSLAFTNSGVVTVSESGLFITSADYTQTAGSTLVNGSLTATDGAVVDIQGGTLQGTGTINGDVTMGGTLIPGDDPDTLTINGDYHELSTGTFDAIIGPILHSVLDVNGDAVLDPGSWLDITLADGFDPLGQTFDIMHFYGLTGEFANGTSFWDENYLWGITYGPNEIDVTALQAPEPGTFGLLGIGLLGLLAYSWRYRARSLSEDDSRVQ
jgi:hypothetical protein